MNAHEQWYYCYYDKIFGWNRNYYKEIELIDSLLPLDGKIVEEIGSGTGNHITEILKFHPRKINAVDCDPMSINLLKQKFQNISELSIYEEDGFSSARKVNIIICLYCVLQQTTLSEVLFGRIIKLITRVKDYNISAFFEIIDTDKHAPHEFLRIYSSGSDYVDIKSERTNYGISIIYTGKIDTNDVFYKVPIYRFPFELLDKDKEVAYKKIPLNKSGRKLLIALSSKVH